MTPISAILESNHVPHRVFVHDGSVRSLEQAAAERGQEPGQVVRTILFRLSEGEYAMVLVGGPSQILWRALRAYFGRSRLTMADQDEVLAVTGYPIGAVAPFGVPGDVPVLVDRSVLAYDEISMGSGVRGTAIILRSADLLAALGDVPVGDFVEENESDA